MKRPWLYFKYIGAVQRKTVVNNVDVSSLRASVRKQTHRTVQKHTEHQDATDIKNKHLLCVFRMFLILCFIYDYLNDFSKNC